MNVTIGNRHSQDIERIENLLDSSFKMLIPTGQNICITFMFLIKSIGNFERTRGRYIHPPYRQKEKAETVIQTNKIHWFLCKRFRFSNFMGK